MTNQTIYVHCIFPEYLINALQLFVLKTEVILVLFDLKCYCKSTPFEFCIPYL